MVNKLAHWALDKWEHSGRDLRWHCLTGIKRADSVLDCDADKECALVDNTVLDHSGRPKVHGKYGLWAFVFVLVLGFGYVAAYFASRQVMPVPGARGFAVVYSEQTRFTPLINLDRISCINGSWSNFISVHYLATHGREINEEWERQVEAIYDAHDVFVTGEPDTFTFSLDTRDGRIFRLFYPLEWLELTLYWNNTV